MLKNYFKTAWRNLWKNKFYSLINIAGLTAGLAVGILILIWVQDELSYDRFHADSKSIYRVLSNVGSGSDRQIWEASPAPVATKAKEAIPEVKDAVRVTTNWNYSFFAYGDKKITGQHAGYVDPSFFTVFDFRLLKGNPEDPFNGSNSVILTVSAAEKYFGKEDPLGKVLRADNKENFVVSGIMEDFPENSSIKFDMVFPMSHYAKNFGGNTAWQATTIDQDWGNYDFDTYLQLNPGAGKGPVEEKLELIKPAYESVKAEAPFTLQPLTHMHLYKTDGSEGSMQTVRTFFIVAVLILLIACINYVNLSTARSMLRAREVSVRKIIGAGRLQLFLQFIAETALLFLLAGIAAFLLARLLLPEYNIFPAKRCKSGCWTGIFGRLRVLWSFLPWFFQAFTRPFCCLPPSR